MWALTCGFVCEIGWICALKLGSCVPATYESMAEYPQWSNVDLASLRQMAPRCVCPGGRRGEGVAGDGVERAVDLTMEVEGGDKPATVARAIFRHYG